MIHLSEEELKKVKLLDLLFKYVTVDQLKQMVDSQAIVDRLKADGSEKVNTVLETLYKENQELTVKLMSLEGKSYQIEQDFNTLVKVVGRGLNLSADQEYQNMRGRRGVW